MASKITKSVFGIIIPWKYRVIITIFLLGELQGHTNRVLHLALSPEGDRVVSASADETLRFWKLYDI